MRFSSGAEPSTSWLTPQPLVPSMGLKWLRDGHDSANHVAMFSVDGQPGNWNFFGNDWRNHVQPAKTLKPLALSEHFATATKRIEYVGLSEMASYDKKGR